LKLSFSCGVCGKQEDLELEDKNRTYTIGRDMEGLDIKLCSDEKHTLSRIQAHIKWDKNAWRIFDGWSPESASKQDSIIQKPSSFGGTFIKRSSEYRVLTYGTGEELREGDNIFFVVTGKADRSAIAKWINQAGTDAQAAFYKFNSFVFPEDREYFEGFKYKFRVMSDEEQAAKMRSSNIFVPFNFSKELEIGKDHFNSCCGLDIRSSTTADLETQRDFWIPQFNSILNQLLTNYKDYLLILLGDGAYVCFLGNRNEEDINFTFATKFLDRLAVVNADNRRKKIPEWKIRLAVNNGKDLLARVDIAGMKSLNVYGNTITSTARLMAYAKSEPDDIIAGIPFHQEFNNQKFYKTLYSQVPGQVEDKNKVLHNYYLYRKISGTAHTIR
jgi:hypothetical protein